MFQVIVVRNEFTSEFRMKQPNNKPPDEPAAAAASDRRPLHDDGYDCWLETFGSIALRAMDRISPRRGFSEKAKIHFNEF